jgi:hypothetical protein
VINRRRRGAETRLFSYSNSKFEIPALDTRNSSLEIPGMVPALSDGPDMPVSFHEVSQFICSNRFAQERIGAKLIRPLP